VHALCDDCLGQPVLQGPLARRRREIALEVFSEIKKLGHRFPTLNRIANICILWARGLWGPEIRGFSPVIGAHAKSRSSDFIFNCFHIDRILFANAAIPGLHQTQTAISESVNVARVICYHVFCSYRGRLALHRGWLPFLSRRPLYPQLSRTCAIEASVRDRCCRKRSS
jgi:hypothetical protein